MFKKLLDSVQNIFSSREKKMEIRTRELAMRVNQDFENLLKTIKEGEYAITDHQKLVNERERFLRDNESLQVDQNVSRNEDNKRSDYILWVVVSIASVLSVKGLRFFLGEFYGTVNMLIVLFLAFFLAYFIVHGSIYINNFSKQYKESNSFVYYQIKVFAYSMVLFIPAMNLLEGFSSNYRPVVMALNIVGCVIDIILHTSLVSMSQVFTSAEDSKKAIKIMKLNDDALAAADQRLRTNKFTFIKGKAIFTSSVKQFVSSLKELQATNSVVASNVLFLLDNFTIWMINNKVMQHAILPYHADENGHPVIELKYFSTEQDSIRNGWDMLSNIKITNSENPKAESLNNQRPLTELATESENIRQMQNIQKTTEETEILKPDQWQEDNQPMDYDSMLDQTNPNDKIL
jgi:hypothetical protein